MNDYEPNGKSKEDEEEEKKVEIIPTDKKCPYDMKAFWKNINDKFFKSADEKHLNEVNHLILYNSAYDINGDHIFSKIGFPKNVNSLMGKPSELNIKKNNPELVTKLFGMYLYIDKYDYTENNLNNIDIAEEIASIDSKLKKIEENNFVFFDYIRKKMQSDKNSNSIDLNDLEVKRIRLLNISKQIYHLQMRQISECISSIKIDKSKNKYLVEFDKSEELTPIMLEEKQYKNLIKLRDTLNTISIYDLFQEKINSTYTNSSIKKSQKKTNADRSGKKLKKTEKTTKEKEVIQIAKNITINNELCHHCKQKKPVEIMVKCQSGNVSKVIEKPYRHYIINNNTVLKKTKTGAIVYIGDQKEIIENHLNKTQKNSKNDNLFPKQQCKRYFCNFCLKGSYDIIVDQVKNKKDYCCPHCVGNCFCTRCTRYEQILKLVTFYISLEGDLEDLIEFLVKKSNILERLEPSLVINKISIVNITKNDKNSCKSNQTKSNLLKGYNLEEKNNLFNDLLKKKEELEKKKVEADALFNKSLYDKVLVNVQSKFTEMDSSTKLDKLHFLNRKGSSQNEENTDYKLLNKKKVKQVCNSTSVSIEEKRGRPRGRKKKVFPNGPGKVGRPPRLKKRKTRMEKEIQYSC